MYSCENIPENKKKDLQAFIDRLVKYVNYQENATETQLTHIIILT